MPTQSLLIKLNYKEFLWVKQQKKCFWELNTFLDKNLKLLEVSSNKLKLISTDFWLKFFFLIKDIWNWWFLIDMSTKESIPKTLFLYSHYFHLLLQLNNSGFRAYYFL